MRNVACSSDPSAPCCCSRQVAHEAVRSPTLGVARSQGVTRRHPALGWSRGNAAGRRHRRARTVIARHDAGAGHTHRPGLWLLASDRPADPAVELVHPAGEEPGVRQPGAAQVSKTRSTGSCMPALVVIRRVSVLRFGRCAERGPARHRPPRPGGPRPALRIQHAGGGYRRKQWGEWATPLFALPSATSAVTLRLDSTAQTAACLFSANSTVFRSQVAPKAIGWLVKGYICMSICCSVTCLGGVAVLAVLGGMCLSSEENCGSAGAPSVGSGCWWRWWRWCCWWWWRRRQRRR